MNQKRNGAILSYINILVKNGVNFLYVPFLLKYVGQADYGLFQMTNSTIMSLSLLSLGFSSSYVKFYMNYKYSENNEIKIKKLNGFYLLLFFFIAIISLVLGAIIVLKTDSIFGKSLNSSELELTKKLLIVLVINISLTFPSTVFDSYILVNEKFVFQQVRQLIQSVFAPIIAIPFIIIGNGVLTIVIVQTCLTFLFLILNLIYCVKNLKMRFIFTDIPKNTIKEISIFSFFILLNQVVDLINNNAPNFILGVMLGATEVATFSIALQIKNIFVLLSVALSNIYIPTVNKMVSKGSENKDLLGLMIKIGKAQALILFFILGGFIVVGDYFIKIWAGQGNILAYKLVILMVLPSLIPFCQNIGIEIQRAYNKHIFRSIVYIVFAIFSLFITVIGIKFFGLIGATFGYVFNIIFANGILMNWYYHKKMSLDMKKYWMKMFRNTIPFIVCVTLISCLKMIIHLQDFKNFILLGIIYVILYFIVYITVLDGKDREKLKDKFNLNRG